MQEFKISIVGRARVGKSLLLSRFIKDHTLVSCLSNPGSDSTKVPVELILTNEIEEPKIVLNFSKEQSIEITKEDLKEVHEELRYSATERSKVTHITIEAEPADWVKEILDEVEVDRLVIIDTEGVAGKVSELNMNNWKANLFLLVFNSSNRHEFAKSVSTLKPALAGSKIWYCVSIADRIVPYFPEDLADQKIKDICDNEIKEIEGIAQKIKDDFYTELNSLEEERSLLNMKISEFIRKETTLAIPNITPGKEWFENSCNYADRQLRQFLFNSIKYKDTDVELDIDLKNEQKKQSVMLLLNRLSEIAINVMLEHKQNAFNRGFNLDSFRKHIIRENRLISYDNKYLVEKQWAINLYIKTVTYEAINKVMYDKSLCLNEIEQAKVVQMFIANFGNKIVWSNESVYSTDGRERTEQASVVMLLNSRSVTENIDKGVGFRTVLDKSIHTSINWSKNYLLTKDRNELLPLYLSSKSGTYTDEIEKFFELVIRPHVYYSVMSTKIQLGLAEFEETVKQYELASISDKNIL